MRRVVIELRETLSRFLKQEQKRIRTEYGLKVTGQDIVRVLLEQHRLRVMSAAGEDNAMLWYYEKLKEGEIDSSAAATIAAKTSGGTPRKGRPPKAW